MKTSIKRVSGSKYALILILVSFLSVSLKANNWDYAKHISASGSTEINIVESYSTSVFMAGQFTGDLSFFGYPFTLTSSTNSAFITRFDEGNFVWVNQIVGTIGTINGSTIDADGNFYVVGAFSGTCVLKSQNPANDISLTSGGDDDGFVAKYDSQGNLIYAWQVGQSITRNRSVDVVIDQEGNIYVGGFWRGGEIIFSSTVSLNYESSNAWSEGYLVKFLPNGQVDWAKHISGGAGGAARIAGGLTIQNNTIFASIGYRTKMVIDGTEYDGTGTQSFALAAFNTTGDIKWAQTATNTSYVTPGNKITSNKGGVYCVGSFNLPSKFTSADGNHITLESTGNYDGFITKYDFNGNILWANNIGGLSEDKVWGVAAFEDIVSTTGHFNGVIYLGSTISTQDTISSKGFSDTFLVNFLDNGQYIGSASAGGNLYDEPATLSLDLQGNSIIGGNFSSTSVNFGESILENTTGTPDAFLAKHINLRALVKVSNPNCHGDADGGLFLNDIAGGEVPYTYSLSMVNGDEVASGIFTQPIVFNDLETGTYKLVVVDADNNSITRYYHIVAPQPININATVTHVSGCYANDNGAINLTVTGGTGDYTFFWDTERGYGVSPTTQNQGSLTAGIYNVTVTDANGCSATESFELTQPERINFGGSTVTNNSSNSSPNGAINLIVNNGAEPYSFNWKEPNGEESNSQNLSGIRGGAYVLYLEDANGCNVDTVFNVLDENKFNAYITQINNPKCKGGTDGSVTIDLENVTGNITIEWSNGQTDVTTATNLSAGEYWVIVTDDMGTPGDDTDDISLEIPALVGEPLFALDVHATVIKTTCPTDNDGSILLTVNGCSSPYEYSWSTTDGSGIVEDEKDQFNLSVGSYSYNVTDMYGCTVNSSVQVFSTYSAPSFTINVQPDNNVCQGTEVEISVSSGFNYLFVIDDIPQGDYSPNTTLTIEDPVDGMSIKVVGINTAGCTKESEEIILNVIPNVEPPIFVQGATQLCEGVTETYLATAVNAEFIIYSLVSGSATVNPTTGEVTNITENFTIAATAYGYNNCGEEYVELDVIVNPTPTPVISTTDPLEWLENADIDVTLSTDITDAEAYQWFHNNNPISGATQSTYQATQAGIYSMEVTVLGCSGLSNEIEITLIPVYTIAFSVEGENNEPVENAEITIAGYEPLFTNDIGTATIDLPNGDYTYQVSATCYHIYNGTFEVDNSSQMVEVTLNALPEPVFVYGQDMLCEGATETFAAEAEGNLTMIYTIVNGTAAVDPTTGEVTNITDDFTIRATASFADGCEKYTDLEVTVNPIPTPAISTTDPLVWTEGEDISVTFVVDITDGEAYQWLRNDEIISGATENSYQATQAGTYSVEVTRLGCTGVSNSLEITLIPVDTYTVSFYVTNTKQEAVKNAEITITDYSPIITDNDGFAYIDLANGNYTFSVIANDHEEYSDDFEVNGENIVISVELIYVSIPTEQLISAMPYPNPFGNEIYIENEQLIKRVIISNVAGQKILDTTLNESIINTSEFKPGIYVITLVGHDGNYSIHKMIKQ